MYAVIALSFLQNSKYSHELNISYKIFSNGKTARIRGKENQYNNDSEYCRWFYKLDLSDVFVYSVEETHSLTTLHSILSTGSPLKPQSYDYVYRDIKSDLILGSITGKSCDTGWMTLANAQMNRITFYTRRLISKNEMYGMSFLIWIYILTVKCVIFQFCFIYQYVVLFL